MVKRRCGFYLWVRKILWRRAGQPTPVFLLGKPHGQRSLVGYSPWGGERVGNNLATKYQQQLTEDNLFHEEADFLLRVIGSGPGSEQSSEKKSSSVVVPTFLVPETGFVEDNFSTMAGGWLRW